MAITKKKATPGSGKYGRYAPNKTDPKYTLLAKCFSNTPYVKDGAVLDENTYAQQVIDIATAPFSSGNPGLLPSDGISGADPDLFANGQVATGYGNAPNIGDVKWTEPGGPANSYVPDVTSPGPGKTEGIDKNKDPQIGYNDIKPAYAGPGTTEGTALPTEASKTIINDRGFAKRS